MAYFPTGHFALGYFAPGYFPDESGPAPEPTVRWTLLPFAAALGRYDPGQPASPGAAKSAPPRYD